MNIELALIDINNDHVNIKVGLESMIQTHVSPLIIPNYVLLGLLKFPSIRLPGILFPRVPKYLSLYCDAIRVISTLTTMPGSYNFYITIPLGGDPADIFEVFHIESFVQQVPNTSYVVHYT